MAVKSVSIRIEEEMLKKLTYVADYEGRSLNSHLLGGGARPHRRAHRPGAQRQTRQAPVSRNNTPRHLPGRAAEEFPLLGKTGLFFFHSSCSIDFIYVACKFYPFMICCR